LIDLNEFNHEATLKTLLTLTLLAILTSCASKVVMKNCVETDNGFYVCEEL
jgi:hypothetical protein